MCRGSRPAASASGQAQAIRSLSLSCPLSTSPLRPASSLLQTSLTPPGPLAHYRTDQSILEYPSDPKSTFRTPKVPFGPQKNLSDPSPRAGRRVRRRGQERAGPIPRARNRGNLFRRAAAATAAWGGRALVAAAAAAAAPAAHGAHRKGCSPSTPPHPPPLPPTTTRNLLRQPLRPLTGPFRGNAQP